MTNVAQGGHITLNVQFYEYHGGPFYDPEQPFTLSISDSDGVLAGFPQTYNPGNITRNSLGHYAYIWSVPDAQPLGTCTASWSGVIYGVTILATEDFTIIAHGAASAGGPSETLEDSTTILFAGILSPMFVDPDEIVPYFAETNYLEVAELIRNFSMEVNEIMALDSNDTIPWVAYEYVKAATLCSLSRTYPLSATGAAYGFSGGSNTVRLGDFEVIKGTGANSFPGNNGGGSTVGNASDWCQLAQALRMEMLYSRTGMKAVVKGSKYLNPIPVRALPVFSSRSELLRGYRDEVPQGLLDGDARN